MILKPSQSIEVVDFGLGVDLDWICSFGHVEGTIAGWARFVSGCVLWSVGGWFLRLVKIGMPHDAFGFLASHVSIRCVGLVLHIGERGIGDGCGVVAIWFRCLPWFALSSSLSLEVVRWYKQCLSLRFAASLAIAVVGVASPSSSYMTLEGYRRRCEFVPLSRLRCFFWSSR